MAWLLATLATLAAALSVGCADAGAPLVDLEQGQGADLGLDLAHEGSPDPLSQLTVLPQGPLRFDEELPLTLDGRAALSWLALLTQPRELRFTIASFGGPRTLDARLTRWDQAQGLWREVVWLQARADRQQRLVLSRALEPGFYSLLLSTPEPWGDAVMQPYTLLAQCADPGCQVADPPLAPSPLTWTPPSTPTPPEAMLAPEAIGMTEDLRRWLADSPWASYDLARADLQGGSYGGRLRPQEGQAKPEDKLERVVLFIHGNGDRALDGPLGGWRRSLEAFTAAGYSSAQLYAMTWGPGQPLQASAQYHSRAHLSRVRAFIEAILAYTGAQRVDIIAHSMGVTLARRALLGGPATDLLDGGDYELGPPLTDRVDAFIGIAGANRGLIACALTGPTTPTCGATNGLYPGTYAGRQGRSSLLRALDAQRGYEGRHVFTIWSPQDELINPVGRGSIIFGEVTSRIPGQRGELVLTASHLDSRDLSAAQQIDLVERHTCQDLRVP